MIQFKPLAVRKWSNRLVNVFRFIVLGLLVAPATVRDLAAFSGISVVLGLLFCDKIGEQKLKKNNYLMQSGIGMLLMSFFYLRWRVSSKIYLIANVLRIPTVAIIISIALLSFLFVRNIVEYALYLLNEFKRKKYSLFEPWLIIIAVSFMEYFQFQYGALADKVRLIEVGGVQLLNIVLLMIVNLCISTVFQSFSKGIICSGVISTIWGIVNYYTVKFHGAPCYPSEFLNAKTALSVLPNYSFSISAEVVVLFSILLIELGIAKEAKMKFNSKLILRSLAFCACGCVCIVVYFNTKSYSLIRCGWETSLIEYGFPIVSIEDFNNQLNPFMKPVGYDPKEKLENIEWTVSAKSAESQYPDIILILNESFFDIPQFYNVSSDEDYLTGFYSIENAHYGWCVVPNISGGTNNSEFELLTSKSMYLLNGYAPFNYVDFTNASSIVQYLGKLGYSRSAFHCMSPENYSRKKAYPQLGFDQVFLGKDNFVFSTNGQRPWLDSDNYADMINVYENNLQVSAEVPQFLYLLTYQNHGDWEQNDAMEDTIHTLNFTGKTKELLDEYMSSVKLSSDAFKDLIKYYKTVERDVIICMVGDHAPWFLNQLDLKEGLDSTQKAYASRMVPYVIWSNSDKTGGDLSSLCTMTDICPIIAQMAGLPLSTFYSYILRLHDELPIRASDGTHVNCFNEKGEYKESDEYFETLRKYYSMEYNSLIQKDDYWEELFLPRIK